MVFCTYGMLVFLKLFHFRAAFTMSEERGRLFLAVGGRKSMGEFQIQFTATLGDFRPSQALSTCRSQINIISTFVQ